MPVTRKRHQQQLQRDRQEQSLNLSSQQPPSIQQQQQQDKRNNNTNHQTIDIDNTNDDDRADLQTSNHQQRSHQHHHHQQPANSSETTKASYELLDQNDRPLVAGDEAAAIHLGFQNMLESDLYCAICREIYINPQILNCAHSFCKFCLDEWLNKKYGCPSCRMVVVFQTENLALKNIINKMVSTSSKKFQDERKASLDQRSSAECQQKTQGILPKMESKSFFMDGRPRPIPRHNYIKAWRGCNGATIWQTKLDTNTGKAISRDDPNQSSSSSSSSSSSDDTEHADDADNIGDVEIYDNDYFSNGSDSDLSYAHEYMPGADVIDLDGDDDDDEIEVLESSSESASTPTVNMDSSSDDDINAYVASRRRRMNDLNILAGNIDADDDESWEPLPDQSSNSMDYVDTESEGESAVEIFGMLARAPTLESTDSEVTSSESNSDDEDNTLPVEFEETTEDESSSNSSSDGAEEDSSDWFF